MSADTADAMLAHAQTTVEEDTAIERVHDFLLEGRLEEELEWLGEIVEWFEEDGPPLERREEELDSDCPLAMAAEQNPEPNVLSPTVKQPSEVESPPLSEAGVERSVYQKDWGEAIKSELGGQNWAQSSCRRKHTLRA